MPANELQSRRLLHQHTDISIFSWAYHDAWRHARKGAQPSPDGWAERGTPV